MTATYTWREYGRVRKTFITMEDKFDKAVSAMKERTQKKERQGQNDVIDQKERDSELLSRWQKTYDSFVQQNLEKLKMGLVESGYSNVIVECETPTSSGFIAQVSGLNPDDGALRKVTLNYTTPRELTPDRSWQQLHIQCNGQRIGGILGFGPDMEEQVFKDKIWSLFFSPHMS